MSVRYATLTLGVRLGDITGARELVRTQYHLSPCRKAASIKTHGAEG
jgi:hypothetical protein